MKTLSLRLRPSSAFSTPPKGDTLFGHFCWIAAERDEKQLAEWLSNYDSQPFLVISTAFPTGRDGEGEWYALPRPSWVPPWSESKVQNEEEEIKQRKKRKQLRYFRYRHRDNLSVVDDLELLEEEYHVEYQAKHNTINRLTGTTGTAPFAPYSLPEYFYSEGIELNVFVIYDDARISAETVVGNFKRMGSMGFGGRASTGRGRFDVGDSREIDLAEWGVERPDALLTLAPSVPETNGYREVYFKPFTRFGRHGGTLARSGNPFKAPVIMADEGAVLMTSEKRTFVGQAIRDVSAVCKETVHQGYAPVLGIRLSDKWLENRR